MGKKKKARRKALISKIYLWIFIVASFFTGLLLSNLYAYADLEACKLKGVNAFYESNGPVGFVLRMNK